MTIESRFPSEEEKAALYQKIKEDAEQSGYHINPDQEFVLMLMNGLLINNERYGYLSCPCRLADGSIDLDKDIVCPCDYRDPDLSEYDACYCALYVSGKVLAGEIESHSIPERRPTSEERSSFNKSSLGSDFPSALDSNTKLAFPVWRCKVCGYLCARTSPPETCPICKVSKERFERFL